MASPSPGVAVVAVSMSPVLSLRIREYVIANDRTISSVMREAAVEFLDRHEAESNEAA